MAITLNFLRTATVVMLAAAMMAGCAGTAPELAPDKPGAIELYKLSAGDKLRISVYNEAALTGEFGVASDGTVSFPLVGNLSFQGKTVSEAQEQLRSALANGYLNNPRVTLEVINYRPFYVLGEVGHPGEYPFQVGLTVPQAVAIAGGYSYRANTKVLFVKRGDDAVEKKVDVSHNTVYVRPGDTIRVGERYF